jgi:hypothetical protein
LDGRVKDAFDLKKTIQEVFTLDSFLVLGSYIFLNYDHLGMLMLALYNTVHCGEFLQATYLAEAVGAGMGSSFQGFVKSVFQR